MAAWRFYVYEILEGEECVYVGKGSGTRLASQRRRFKREGREICRFKIEAEAYMFERGLIFRRKPRFNIAPGQRGNEMDRLGMRKYAAIMLLRKGEPALSRYIGASEMEKLRQVANGPRL